MKITFDQFVRFYLTCALYTRSLTYCFTILNELKLLLPVCSWPAAGIGVNLKEKLSYALYLRKVINDPYGQMGCVTLYAALMLIYCCKTGLLNYGPEGPMSFRSNTCL